MIKCFPDIHIKPQATVHLYEAQRLITGRQYRIQCKKGSVVVTTSPDDQHDDGFLIVLDDYLNMSGDVWVTNLSYGTAIVSISETGDSSTPPQVEDINITPQSTSSMESNSTLQFTSDAPGAIYAVTKGVGSITSTGLYTAPPKGYEGTTTIEAHLDNRWGKATIGQIISNVKITSKHYSSPVRAGEFVSYDELFTVTGASKEAFTYRVVPTEAGIFDISGLNISNLFTGNTIMIEASYSEDMTVNGVALLSNVNPVLSGLRMEIRLGDESSYNSNTQTWNMEKGFQYGVVVYPVPDGSVAPDILLSTNEPSIVSEQPTPGVFLITANNEFTGKGLNFQSNGVELQITINSTVKPTIVGKEVSGKIGGDKVFFTEMFTSNTASSSFAYTVTPNTNVSINTTTGVLTLGDNASGTYTVVATHRTQPDVTATATIVATPELVGVVLQGVTNGVAVGGINLPSVTDSLTITDPNIPAVFRIDTVFQGALLGSASYSFAGSEISKIGGAHITGELLTISLDEPLFSDDTSITITAGDVTRTYLLYSGE